MKPTRLFDIPYQKLKSMDNCLTAKINGVWHKISTNQFIEQANALSRALVALGIKKHDKIGIITHKNCPLWNILDMGILQVGAVNVTVYNTLSDQDTAYVFQDSGVKVCFVSNDELADKVTRIKDGLTSLEALHTFDEILGSKMLKPLIELAKDPSGDLQKEVEIRKKSVTSTDMATIIYTSGTTGKPKGVVISHLNIISNIETALGRLPKMDASNSACALSFLPVSHIFERMLLYGYMYLSIPVYFAESIEAIGDNLKEIKPHIFTAVPRLLEKIYDKIVIAGNKLTGIKKAMFFWALSLGTNYKPGEKNGFFFQVKLTIARAFVFSKWREALGGKIKVIAIGGAALQPRLARIFMAAQIPVLEGYGLTETSPIIAVNSLQKGMYRAGTVGKPLENIDVKISEQGEILVKGPSVFKAYYNNPEKTAEAIDQYGFFHTGDIGVIEDGFLRITDRMKEIFKTSGGKYVAPQGIENLFKESFFIENLMVLGDGEKMPTALIQIDFHFIQNWAKRKNILLGKTNEDIIANLQVIQRIEKEVERLNKRLGHWEQIKKFELVPEVWSFNNGLLTPTLKLKRKEIVRKYEPLYHKLYPKENL